MDTPEFIGLKYKQLSQMVSNGTLPGPIGGMMVWSLGEDGQDWGHWEAVQSGFQSVYYNGAVATGAGSATSSAGGVVYGGQQTPTTAATGVVGGQTLIPVVGASSVAGASSIAGPNDVGGGSVAAASSIVQGGNGNGNGNNVIPTSAPLNPGEQPVSTGGSPPASVTAAGAIVAGPDNIGGDGTTTTTAGNGLGYHLVTYTTTFTSIYTSEVPN